MFQKHQKLLKRFILCYLLAVFIPIALLSFMIYHYFADQRIREYTTDRIAALLIEQHSLENHLNSVHQYFSQLQSDYELRQVLHGICTSEHGVVYAYNTQMYSLLSNLKLYDTNIRSISIYTENKTASKILKEFFPMEEQPFSDASDPLLLNGTWQAETEEGGVLSPVFYAGFTNPPLKKNPGILRIAFHNQLFDQYATQFPDSDISVYLNQSLLYQSNPDSQTAEPDAFGEYVDPALSYETPRIFLDESNHRVVSIFSLCQGTFHVIKLTPESETLFSYRPFVLSLLFSGFLLIFASIAVFLVLFRAMQNIIRLSEHMNQQNEPRLTLYTGKIASDETGDLALSFNQMAQHINELSDSLLNSEIQLKNAQIESLQSQLNPHFFYGTLESIRMIAEMNHQTLISDIAFSFANLMRYSLSREYLVPIERELDIIRQYLSIQEKRLGNRFDVTWEIPELNDKWRCPKFAIFNMVENVFSHNVSKCREFIHIFIIITREDMDMTITVKNTGLCISPERLKELCYLLEHPKERGRMTSENNGRGIFNISDRLKLFYGEEYTFSIDSEPGKGTVCSIRIHR